MIAELKSNEVVVDVFCGIGPFSIRAANEVGCVCHANDLNPACFKYLQKNIKVNKVGGRVTGYCMDGRQFMRLCFQKVSLGQIERIDHFYMNLPAIGVDFLDVFNDQEFKGWKFGSFKIHTTCFEETEKEESETIDKVKKRIGLIMNKVLDCVKFLGFQFIKNVSKKKNQVQLLTV